VDRSDRSSRKVPLKPAAKARSGIAPRTPRRAEDRALVVGARAHFEDAAYYTKTYGERRDDVAFYVGLAEQHRGRVLEYGIGNGRIAIPMARAGCDVTGIDWSEAMLADLENKRLLEPKTVARRVRGVHGDMREAGLAERFPLVLSTFNTFLHLYTRTDVERFLARAREHLAPGGRLVIDVSVPQPGDLDRDPSRLYKAPRLRHPTTGQLVSYGERFDYDAARQILFVTIEFSPVDGSPGWVVPLAHRQFFPEELSALFHYNGFVVESVNGGFSGEVLTRHSDHAVWTLSVARHSGASLGGAPTPRTPKK
jgi:SAM-dependent methyltransferase